MRGEHRTHGESQCEAWGSSPHARGTRQLDGFGGLDGGIIPACAGNTKSPSKICSINRDHPRMRGEHGGFSAKVAESKGSSPHARGTPVTVMWRLSSLGIIPACAGNTPCRASLPIGDGDHPRMRGEHFGIEVAHFIHEGSSPHARGTHGQSSEAEGYEGIIPACAGNTVNCGVRG